MDICQVETGLLKKKPCGQPGVTRCVNCEQALCSKHAVGQLNEGGHKTGKFLCKECDAAHRANAKALSTKPTPAQAVKKPEAAPAAAKAAAPAAAKPAPTAAPAKPAAPAAAAPKPAEKKPDMDDSGPIEFTPTKK